MAQCFELSVGFTLLPLQIPSLTHYLFPRMTVCVVSRSEAGCLAQETLEEMFHSPPELTISAAVAAASAMCW